MLRVATIPPLVDLHAEDAAFLWSRRRLEIDGPFLDATEIGRIDQRLEANLEGLMAAGEAGWQAALNRFEDYAEPPELFVIGAIALRSGEDAALGKALDLARPLGAEGVAALSAAMLHGPREGLRGHLPGWIDARDPFLCGLGLAVLRHYRADPGDRLPELIGDRDAGVRCAALALAGALGRVDMLVPVQVALDAEAEEERMAAARAACLLGEARLAHPVLDRIVLAGGATALECIELRLLTTPKEQAKRWLQGNLGRQHLRAEAVRSIGLFGERTIMPWLIERMRDPELCEAAGLALRDLFEVDFGDVSLFTADPSSLGETFADIDALALPVADAVSQWWDDGRGGGRGMRPFRSMRRERLDALTEAIAEPARVLGNWRRTRSYPMWM
ncbi:MAG: hypothetical protein M9924_19410 [Rhizobiaceae bacterium]|nr:hypothetical protein [Rhizobiaceae bacterium]